MVFFFAIAKRYGDHVAYVPAILVDGYTVGLCRVARVYNVVRVFAAYGDAADRECK